MAKQNNNGGDSNGKEKGGGIRPVPDTFEKGLGNGDKKGQVGGGSSRPRTPKPKK